MKLGIASGKGGAGKTTLATNLACVASRASLSVAYLDCDVEEPNAHIFLKPRIDESIPAGVLIPEVDESKCNHCGACGEICRFRAIVPLPETTLVFAEMCHGCGGCSLVCPARAIREVPHEVGKVKVGRAGPIVFVEGELTIGRPMSTPVIRKVRAMTPARCDLVIVDAPPGTSCPVIASIRGCDYVILITEPTPFGLNDLKLAVETVRALELPFAVVVNRADSGDGNTASFCRANDIEILAEIPEDRRIAEVCSRGEMVCRALPEYRRRFESVLEAVMVSVA